jgi:hypothetical protein
VAKKVWIVAFTCILVGGRVTHSQESSGSLSHIPHSSTLTFIEQDGTCIDGPIAASDATKVEVRPYGKPPVTISRSNLLQIRQGDALIFSAVSLWADVEQTPVYPRESLVLKLASGKVVQGKPAKVTPDSLALKHGLITTSYKKADIVTVDYLRLKPESDGFDYFSQEAPGLLFFYPEFYSRLIGMEGRIPVRLYDATKPQATALLKCSRH